MQFPKEIPFLNHLGFELLRFHGGEAELALTLREELTNAWGVAHGGATMTLLDATMAHAACSPAIEGDEAVISVVTIEMKTSFMRPGLGRLVAHAKVLQRTASLSFCEGAVRGPDGTLVAHATATFKHVKGLPVGGRLVMRQGASD